MIKKSLLIAFVLFLFYSILMHLKSGICIIMNQWDDNISKAEKFVYDVDLKNKSVLVGSSLIVRVKVDSLKDFVNIGIQGGSPFDGLNFIKQKEVLPKNIFVEINCLERSESKDIISAVSVPYIKFFKSRLYSLRSDKKPISIFVASVNKLSQILFKENAKPDFNKPIESIDLESTNYYKEMLKSSIINYNNPDTILIKNNIKRLKTELTYFTDKNIQIVFFELPLHPELFNLKKSLYLRYLIKSNFTYPRYRFIKVPNPNDYITTDCAHLTEESGYKFANYLKSEIKNLK